ncbi:DUF763 domain-containing protein [candidate division WOR-3 bacterium]|nr:DUF763 domain-containing protein [candidate division WOR-3 bacterium]
MKTGTINLPLHGGKAPAWLFKKMKKLARCITICIVEEEGTKGFLNKISSPLWFQSLGCILGFDWHSSGLTTVACAALKEGIKEEERKLGLFVAGGKGAHSRKTPVEIKEKASLINTQFEQLVYASRMSAKVDSSAVQDGYQIYQHMFFFTHDGNWAVIQQGMNPVNRYARRYHWLSGDIDFVCEPHSGIISPTFEDKILNLVSKKSGDARTKISELAKEHPDKTERELLTLPERHPILTSDINPKKLHKIFIQAYERAPQNFEELLAIRGVGPKTLRALALLSELLYGTAPDFTDPARFSYAHGGKDGYPYPVDREGYEKTISILERAIKSAKLGRNEELSTLKKLYKFSI